MRMTIRRLAVILLGVGIVVVGASVALTQTPPPPRPVDDVSPCEWPCPGHKYVVVYDLRDGSIIAVDGYDPSDPEGGRPVPAAGQTLLDITGFKDLLDLRTNLDAYVVDLTSLSLTKQGVVVAPTVGSSAPSVTEAPNP